MTADELICLRKEVGLSREALARHLAPEYKVSFRTIESWEQGIRPIPDTWATILKSALLHQDVLKIPLSPELRKKLVTRAKESGKDPAVWAVELLKSALLSLAVAILAYHTFRPGTDWSGPSLLATLRLAGGFVAGLFS